MDKGNVPVGNMKSMGNVDSINDYEQLKRFHTQLKSAYTIHAKTQLIMTIINSPQNIIDKFAQSSSLRVITSYLKEGLKNLHTQEDLVEKIMTLIIQINLNEDILRDSEIGSPFLKMRERKILEQIKSKELLESIQNKWIKYYTKYRNLLEDWKSNKSSQHKKKYEEPSKKKVKRSSSSSSSPKKQKKKSVRFARDDQLLNLKYFRREDEPNAPGLTSEDVYRFQKQYAEELKRLGPMTAYDLKHRESLMEGKSHKQIMDNVQQMIEQIIFIRPIKLRLPQQDYSELMSVEALLLQQRTESKMSAFYHRDIGIPNEPGYLEIQNQTKPAGPIRVIHLDPPKREDLMQMVQVMCSHASKEMQDKRKKIMRNGVEVDDNNKPIKGILKKPPEEIAKQKDALLQAKQNLQPKILQLNTMIEQRQEFSQENILSLLHDIIQKLKEIGSEQYIQNVKQIIEAKLNSKQSIQNEDMLAKQRQEQMKLRIEQLQVINPLQAQRMRAYKTKHCHNYHSARGCTRGDACNFIHDPKYMGIPVPMSNPILNMPIPNLLNKTPYNPQLIQSLAFNAPPILQSLNPNNMLGTRQYKQYESL